MAKMVIFLVALATTFSFADVYGFRVGFNLYDYSSGEKEMDKYVKKGYGFGGGLAVSKRLSSVFSFVQELNFLYRRPMILDLTDIAASYGISGKTESYITEFAISTPIMFQLTLSESIPYFAAGVQLDVPISSKMTAKVDGKKESKDIEDRVSIDFGIALGIGYLITSHTGVDVRAVIGLTSPLRNGDDSWNQYGLGLTYYF